MSPLEEQQAAAAESRDAINTILSRILDKSHPKMVMSLYQVAVPYWFNSEILAVIRQARDDKERGIIERLDQFSFVFPLYDRAEDVDDYAVDEAERDLLNRRFIAEDGQAYLLDHWALLTYWERNEPDRNSFLHQRNLLYHRFFVDFDAASKEFQTLYTVWFNNRELNAINEMVEAVTLAHLYLNLLHEAGHLPPEEKDELDRFGELLIYVKARVAQVEGELDKSETLLNLLALAPDSKLTPYVTRLRGYIDRDRQDYAAAIDHFEAAIDAFDAFQSAEETIDPENYIADRATTQIDLGSAFASLSGAAGGTHAEPIRPSTDFLSKVGDFIYLLLSIPLVIFLGQTLGLRVLRPGSWHIFRHLDWIRTRFYIAGAQIYQIADPILEKYLPELGNLADERLGHLWLDLGDAEAALEKFSELLEDDTLKKYRKATIQLGKATALVRLGRNREAKPLLQTTLASLIQFTNRPAEAQARALLGEILVEDGEIAPAITQFRAARNLYRDANREAEATAAQGAIEQLYVASGQGKPLSDAHGSTHLIYPLRYRHWTTRFIQSGIIALFFAGSFLGATLLFRLEDQSVVAPTITFRPAPLLAGDINEIDLSNLDVRTAGNLVFDHLASTEVTSLILWAAAFFLLYLLLITVLGLWVIFNVPPRDLQMTGERQAVYLDGTGIRQGTAGTRIDFAEISHIYTGDVAILNDRMADESLTIIEGGGKQIRVSGNIIGYPDLIKRVVDNAQNGKLVNYSYSFLRSPLGALLLATFLFFSITTIIANFQFDVLDQPIFGGTNYSVADLYPWLLMGFYIPIVWWFVIAPTRIYQQLQRPTRFLWGLLGIAGFSFLLLFFRFGLDIRPFPNIYVPLTALISALCAAWLLLRQSQLAVGWLRQGFLIALYIGLLIIMLGASLYLTREIQVYHHQVQGNRFRNELEEIEDVTARNGLINNAIESYSTAIEWSRSCVEVNSETEAWCRPLFLIGNISPSILADLHASRGLMELGRASGLEVAQSVQNLVTEGDDGRNVGADSLFDYDYTGSAEQFEPDYLPAIDDFTRAISLTQSAPNANYHLWRGYLYQARGEIGLALADYKAATNNEITDEKRKLSPNQNMRALTALGWILYDFEEYDKALDTFSKGIVIFEEEIENAKSAEDRDIKELLAADNALGQGYANYALGETGVENRSQWYESAGDSFARVAELNPEDPLGWINRGMAHRKLAVLGERTNEQGVQITNFCSSLYADQPQIQYDAATNLDRAIEYLTVSTEKEGQSSEELAVTWQRIGQMHFLQRSCPGNDREISNLNGFDAYSRAAALNPTVPEYYFRQANFGYAAWTSSTAQGAGARVILMDALAAAERLISLAPNNDNYQRTYRAIRQEAEIGSLNRGGRWAMQGEYQTAFEYFELVSNNISDNLEAPFLAAEMRLELNDVVGALDWYTNGIARAQLAGRIAPILEAKDRLPADTPADIQALFDAVDLNYVQPATATDAFAAVHAALVEDQPVATTELFQRGLDLSIREGTLTPIRVGLLRLLAHDPIAAQPYLELTANVVGDLRLVAEGNDNNTLAFDLGFIGLALDDIGLAVIGYNEGVRRTVLPNHPYSNLSATQGQMAALWRATGRNDQAEALLLGIEDDLPAHLDIYPEMVENGTFWRYRGWMKYQISGAAFRAGNEPAALQGLALAQPDADRAAGLGAPGSDIIHTYLPQGAFGWFHVLAGDDAVARGDIAQAISIYVAGVTVFDRNLDRENLNETAVDEYLAIHGRMIWASLQTGAYMDADEWGNRLLAASAEFGRSIQLEPLSDRLFELELDTEGDAVRAAILARLEAEQ